MKNIDVSIAFVSGEIALDEYMNMALSDPSVFEALQELVPNGAKRCVQKIENGQIVVSYIPYIVSSYLTEMYNRGLIDDYLNIFAEVRDIVLSEYPDTYGDSSIEERFCFIMVQTPAYIGGHEAERILMDIYEELKDIPLPKRKKAYHDQAKLTFHITDIFPHWIQSPEWPCKNGLPMKFVSEKKIKEGLEYVFCDTKTNETVTIKQFY